MGVPGLCPAHRPLLGSDGPVSRSGQHCPHSRESHLERRLPFMRSALLPASSLCLALAFVLLCVLLACYQRWGWKPASHMLG